MKMEWIARGFGHSEVCWLMYSVVLVCIALVIYIALYVVCIVWELYVTTGVNTDGCEGLNLPPGTMGYPLLGETVEFLRKRCTFYQEKNEKYGLIYKTHLLGRPTIRVIGADNVKKILMGENSLVTSNWPTSARILLGAGSISQSAGIVHSVRRKSMLRAFSFETLNSMIPVMQEVISKSLMDWRERKKVVYTYSECKLMAFTVAACALIGMDMTSSKRSGMHDTFVDLLENMMTLPLDIPGFGFRKGLKAKQKLLNEIRDLLPETEKRPHSTILRAYYESCLKLGTDSEDEIYEGVLDLLFAGHETVTSGATSCVMFLGQNRDVLDKLRCELADNDLLQVDSDLNFKVINDLKYLKNVVKEVLRMCPPVGAGFRKALKSFSLGGYLIPKDWTVMFSIRETQQLSPMFEHSEKFDPDRWDRMPLSTGENSNPEGFNYIPFGFGARGCVGKMYAQLVIKVFLIELVRSCDWDLINKNIEMTYIPIPVARDHLPAVFGERSINSREDH